jgi:hypothetical protein
LICEISCNSKLGQREEGRRKKEEGRRKKEEGRRKKEELSLLFPFPIFLFFPLLFFLRKRGRASGYRFPGRAWKLKINNK